MSPLPPPVVQVEKTGRATLAATAGATRLVSPLLACSGARALVLSLLEQRCGDGVDGPSTSEP